MNYYPEFARRLNEMLGKTDRSPAWLARRLGVNPSTVNRWLNHGARPGDPESVVRIADILGASVERQSLLVAAGYGYMEEPGSSVEVQEQKAGRPQTAELAAHSVDLSLPIDESLGQEIPNNLPVQATSYVGRSEELHQLGEWLADPQVRLATVVGPGGMGKTRLALAAAQAQFQGEHFAHGVFFVALATITTREDMITTIADTVGLSAAGSDPESMVLGQLQARNMLLVLDNFEQLMPPPASWSRYWLRQEGSSSW